MRDLDRWKDKVELQLDGRQIFFLFFGSALCACLIFVLGVVVGKRVEARAAAQAQTPAEDPLAALDELGNAEEGLTFHSALAGDRTNRKGKPGKEAASKDEAEQASKGELRGAFAGVGAGASATATPPVTEEPDEGPEAAKPAAKPEDKKPTAVAAKPEDKKPAAATPPKPEDKKPAAVAAKPEDKKPTVAAPPKPEDKKPTVVAAAPAKQDPKAKGHFTLQLSAFSTKAEANDFLKRLRDAGYKPYVSESMVPGKGLMYRVRLGDFSTRDLALTAKGDFERKQKIVAYVAKL